jgi:hypothetical protein
VSALGEESFEPGERVPGEEWARLGRGVVREAAGGFLRGDAQPDDETTGRGAPATRGGECAASGGNDGVRLGGEAVEDPSLTLAEPGLAELFEDIGDGGFVNPGELFIGAEELPAQTRGEGAADG